jgi:hypothetical protein
MQYESFLELMDRPDIVELADRMGGDQSAPEFIDRFMALTWACANMMPEEELAPGAANSMSVSGVCVFYAPEILDGEHFGWEPWTCRINLGASAYYVFEKVGDATQVLGEGDSWNVPAEGRPTTADLGWQERTMALLRSSRWRVLNDPAQLCR